jgi:hypothetical protein
MSKAKQIKRIKREERFVRILSLSFLTILYITLASAVVIAYEQEDDKWIMFSITTVSFILGYIILITSKR